MNGSRHIRYLLLMLCMILSACSGNYEKRWRQTLNSLQPGISGAWQGHWKSHRNGHEGKLRCIVTPLKTAPTTYRFDYHATWAKVLRASFTIECATKSSPNGVWKVSGKKDLGSLFGGEFSHDAEIRPASPATFKAQYQSALDQGVMEMTRP
jgi:hypothetical protein